MLYMFKYKENFIRFEISRSYVYLTLVIEWFYCHTLIY